MMQVAQAALAGSERLVPLGRLRLGIGLLVTALAEGIVDGGQKVRIVPPVGLVTSVAVSVGKWLMKEFFHHFIQQFLMAT